jgi:hypothetical protein
VTEQQPYDVLTTGDGWELRRYPAHVVAETVVRGASFEDAGNRAFRLLVGYIGGENTARRSIEMTAPVVQSPAESTRLAMTAPVVQSPADDGYTVAFVLPADITADTAPIPLRPEVTIRAVPEAVVAASRFTGRWTEHAHDAHRDALLAKVRAANLTPVGAPRFARFNAPITPSFLRRNEVQVDVESAHDR